MPSRPGSAPRARPRRRKGRGPARRARTPKSRAGSMSRLPRSRASAEKADSDLSDTASEGEAENAQDTADRIAETDELGLSAVGPGAPRED